MNATQKTTKRRTATTKPDKADKTEKAFSAEERAAIRERAREMKAEKRRGASKEDAAAEVLAKIAEMPDSDRDMAERIHAIVQSTTPSLSPRTWYGMPAYANEDGKVVCFFTPAAKFKERYATFGFNADARLDDGSMWPTSWALTKLTKADEAKIAALVKKAAG